MTTSIARQSIILKCTLQKSVLLGNYEFYYAAGLLKKLFAFEVNEEMTPLELSEYLLREIEHLDAKDEKESYLIKIVSAYEPAEDYDEQMKELFRWGAAEPDPWSVTTSYHP